MPIQGMNGLGGLGNPMQGAAAGQNPQALLANPNLTAEDKVTLLLMMIMKKKDGEIAGQANRINQLQAQAQGGQQGAQGGKSIDVETMKLKRSIDKRGQLFDSLRQIIDKYNETAKNVIQSVGR